MKKSFLISLLAIAVMFTGCQKEETAGEESCAGLGRIEISLSSEELVYTAEQSKAQDSGNTLESVTFVINGMTDTGISIVEQPIDFTFSENKAYTYFNAGVYTITATYAPEDAESGKGAICYQGTSEEFCVETTHTTELIEIEMKAVNSKVTIVFDSTLKEFYQNISVTFLSPREFSVSSTEADENGKVTAYLPSSRVATYGVYATPLTNSGASTISVSGMYLPSFAPGSDPILLEAGKAYTINIRIVPGGIAIFLDDEQEPVYTTEELWNGIFS